MHAEQWLRHVLTIVAVIGFVWQIDLYGRDPMIVGVSLANRLLKRPRTVVRALASCVSASHLPTLPAFYTVKCNN